MRRGFLCLDLPCSNPRQKADDGNQRSRHLNSHHKRPQRCCITPGIEQWFPQRKRRPEGRRKSTLAANAAERFQLQIDQYSQKLGRFQYGILNVSSNFSKAECRCSRAIWNLLQPNLTRFSTDSILSRTFPFPGRRNRKKTPRHTTLRRSGPFSPYCPNPPAPLCSRPHSRDYARVKFAGCAGKTLTEKSWR